ncbi:MAG: transcription-repair coupling factor [Lachnospiraceae bacterium]|nr:transcription-repair coupling factor [Lachnospiraceae bacterium]
MKFLNESMRELSDFEAIEKCLNKREAVSISGCVDSQKVHMMTALTTDFPIRLIVTYSDAKAKEIMEDCAFFLGDAVYFPAKDFIFFQADIHGNELSKERIAVYRKVLEGDPVTIVTTFDALMAPCMPLSVLEQNKIFIDRESVVEMEALAAKLVRMGYERVHQVSGGGQFSVRGGIVDIFDLTEENPVRIELWGDEVDSIRSFDVLSQRSIEEKDEVCIYPATELILTGAQKEAGLKKILEEGREAEEAFRKAIKPELATAIKKQMAALSEQIEEYGSLANLEGYIHYFVPDAVPFCDLLDPEETVYLFDEPNYIAEYTKAVEDEFYNSCEARVEKGMALKGQTNVLFPAGDIYKRLEGNYRIAFSLLDTKAAAFDAKHRFLVTAKSLPSFQNSFEELATELLKNKKRGYRTLLVIPSRTRAKRMGEELRDRELSCFYDEDKEGAPKAGQIMIVYGQIRKGFEYPHLKLAVITETDIFGKRAKSKRRKKRYEGEKIRDFSDLKTGDYVVHESHGLGVYQGIEKVKVENVEKDYMKILYRDGGVLYVRATGFDAVMKYASSDATKTPKLNKLGTQEWTKTKSKVKTAVNEVAKELVQLYAVRMNKRGHAYLSDTVWQKEFEELFPYEETEDQLAAIEATKADMESDRIMDRLICGDVGFGKTEIAIRAAFKAVMEGKQVAYLVPTTILAKQHYDTFRQRMKDFPIGIEMLSRFKTAAEQRKTLHELKKGGVDIVIGTHRLLSKDVEFKDLGLLIVDEEQRFGVTHKEKIKQMKKDVDVLTLTATPIPRTLHMSLIGIRDMSLLEEGPEDRQPIQTYVMEYNSEMVREAILRETARGGQVYYVYNRVADIAEVTAKVRELVPDVRVEFAHGKMKERELEDILYDFINGEIDVLVSTTIIETGIDIPNVNTMIIHNSDALGLAQLYQLRGRVGRSSRNAYAFLMYKRDKILREVAQKRLEAIKEFTDLGSGYRIATKDLELRGAGNLLGKMQHGHMEAVGYDLYCKMLNEAVKGLKGIQEEIRGFETTVDLDVNAYIPDEYILNETQKLDIYKRISLILSEEDKEEMEGELKDRFGNLPLTAQNLLRIALLKARASSIYIEEIKGKKNGITIRMYPQAKLAAEHIPELVEEFGGRLRFTYKPVPEFRHVLSPVGYDVKDEENVLKTAEKIVERMTELLKMEDVPKS